MWSWDLIAMTVGLALAGGLATLRYWFKRHNRWSLPAFTIPFLFILGSICAGIGIIHLIASTGKYP